MKVRCGSAFAILFLCVVSCCLSPVCADVVTIGNGSSTWQYPLASNYHDARTQTIYLASEIGVGGPITALALNVAAVPGQTLNLFTIRMKHTPLASYSSAQWESSGWTVVYQANKTISSTGWTAFDFSVPFQYNGSDNLMVDISFNNSSWTSDGYCYRTSRSASRTMYYRTDSYYGDPLLWAGTTPPGYTNSYTPDIQLTINSTTTPVFAPNGGIFDAPTPVTVSCVTPDAVIHYTTTGIDPVDTDPTVASGSSVMVDHSLTLKAKAWKDGLDPSAVRAASYSIAAATPTFSPDSGVFTDPQQVAVSCETPDAVIHYTTTGLDPTEDDPTVESGAVVTVTPTATLKAKAWKTGIDPSPVKSALFRLPGIIYVTPEGSDNNDGFSWQTAKQTIEAGLALAEAGDQVWVAKGTYWPQGSLSVPLGVQLYGGFSGSETLLSERPSFPRPVVDPNETTVNESGYVVSMFIAPPGADAGTRIDGFGIWLSVVTHAANGGAISCVNSSPTIVNNLIRGLAFLDTVYGGGIYCNNASPVIKDNTITMCGAVYGGGISCVNYSAPLIVNNIITGNIAGGDINPIPQPTLGYGGAIYCDDHSSPTIANNFIGANSAYRGGAIFCKNSSAPVIANNTMTSNAANSGGAVYFDATSPTLVNNIVAYNSSGIFSSAPGPTLRNNCVYNPDGANYVGLAPGDGDISLDPKLEAVDYGRVHLQPDSPCVDAGADDVVQPDWLDMDGTARIQGDRVDIGADESDGTQWNFTPTVMRVSLSGSDDNDGSTWEKAKLYIKYAVDKTSRMGGEVWVAKGTHDTYPVFPRPYSYIYGGFDGTETSRDERDWRTNVTTLSIVSYNGDMHIGGGYRAGRVDGFTIVGDYSYQTNCLFTSPVITNNTFSGVGIRCWYSYPVITDNTITGVVNTSPGRGGGISLDHSAGQISSNSITNNGALVGGGIDCYYSSPRITNNTISGNTATSTGATYGGSGIHCDHSSPEISGNTITGNLAGSSSVYGGGIACYYSSPDIAGNTISGNTGAGYGGGISCANYSSPTISRNTITGNTARFGAGMYGSGGLSAPTVSDNVVAGNNASSLGGGIYIAGGPAGGPQPTLLNNTICGNSGLGLTGGGIVLLSGSPVVANNCIAFNSSGVYLNSGTPILRNNCVYNPGGANYTGLTAGTGDISLDPMFVNKAGGDYHLTVISPCVNAGTSDGLSLPDTDMDGEARVQYGIVDIGADECSLKATQMRDTKLAADNVPVDLDAAIVSAAFPDFFYIEADRRESGIRVEKAAHGLIAGVRADVEGVLKKNSQGERCIDASLATANGVGSVEPLGMSNSILGGGNLGFQDAVWRYNSGLGEWSSANGMNNIGLLARIFGSVTVSGRGWFYMDDGSHVEDRSGLVGVYVNAAGLAVPPQGSFVSVTGVSSCDTYLGYLVNTLLPRAQSDIVIVRQAEGAGPLSPQSDPPNPRSAPR